MDQRPPVPMNGKHHPLTREERAKRSPFMQEVKADIEAETPQADEIDVKVKGLFWPLAIIAVAAVLVADLIKAVIVWSLS